MMPKQRERSKRQCCPSLCPRTRRCSPKRAAVPATLGKAQLPAKAPSGVRLLSGIDGDAVFDVRAGADKLVFRL